MRHALALLIVSFVLFGSGRARAEDWLALYPECGFGPEARALGRMAMIYPRPGLPAVVHAGERLVTRVRVPSGLTPPPGIQKDRALRGWSAELVGQSVALGTGGEHVYRTRVVDVRPDGQSTLVYRASIEVPRWAAPGTYGLRMSAPGGSDAVAGAVRILAPDAPLRLLRLPPELLAPDEDDPDVDPLHVLESLATTPHDVVVVDGDALSGILESARPDAALPAILVVDESLPIVLREGDDTLLVFGECDDRYAPFAMQLEGLARREGREPHPFADVFEALDAAEAAWLRGPVTTADGEAMSLAALGTSREMTVRYPDDGRAVDIEGAEATFYPAVTIPMTGQVRTIAVRLAIDEGASARVSRRGARGGPLPTIAVEPRAALESGERVRFSIEPEGLATIAWRLEEDITLVGPRIEHVYRPVGEERVDAYVITEEGVGKALTERVIISTREVRGCGCGASASASGGPSWVDLWLIALVLLKMGVRRRNRLLTRRR